MIARLLGALAVRCQACALRGCLGALGAEGTPTPGSVGEGSGKTAGPRAAGIGYIPHTHSV